MLTGQAKTDYQRDYMRRRRSALSSRMEGPGLTVADGRKTQGIGSRRFRILHRDNFRCCYCGKTPKDDVKLELDHIIPICKGGTDDDSNLITACMPCNRAKAGHRLNYDAEQSIMPGLTDPPSVRPEGLTVAKVLEIKAEMEKIPQPDFIEVKSNLAPDGYPIQHYNSMMVGYVPKGVSV